MHSNVFYKRLNLKEFVFFRASKRAKTLKSKRRILIDRLKTKGFFSVQPKRP